MIFRLALALLLLISATSRASTIHVATAANFAAPLAKIADQFEADTGHEVVVSSGSTGLLFAQIVNGAPFDLFLAADRERPERLEASGHGRARATYAIGRLVLASHHPDRDLRRDLREGRIGRVALANPELAPYGRAAAAVIEALGADSLEQIRAENVGQAHHFLESRTVDAAFVSAAQLLLHPQPSTWDVPAELHPPIEQQLLLLSDDGTAVAFRDFLLGEIGRDLIGRAGYDLPSK